MKYIVSVPVLHFLITKKGNRVYILWGLEWIQKYLLGWTVDGWHFCKILFLTSLLSMVGYMIKLTKKQKWYLAFIYTLILLIAWGLLFELFY